MLWTDKAHTQMPCGTGVAQKSRHRFDGLKPPSTNWLYVPCRPIVGTKSRSGESGLWHRCSAEVSTPLNEQEIAPAPFGYMQSAGQSWARSREPGESAQWHRCSHVELSVQIHPPSGLKADWGDHHVVSTATGTPTSPIPGVFVDVRRPTRNARTCRNSTPTNTDGPIARIWGSSGRRFKSCQPDTVSPTIVSDQRTRRSNTFWPVKSAENGIPAHGM